MHEQGEGGKDRRSKLDYDPVVAEQTPGGSKRLQKPSGKSGETQRDDDKL